MGPDDRCRVQIDWDGATVYLTDPNLSELGPVEEAYVCPRREAAGLLWAFRRARMWRGLSRWQRIEQVD